MELQSHSARNNPTLAPPRTTPLLSPAEVSAILGVTVETLSVWRCVNRYPSLKYVKVGRSVRYRREAVDAFVTERTV
ncbi:MAG: helix-turn-helix domain-containing protein [Chlorobium sp.]|nr:helix-turn-helix domain-containing protein [Chlorobium sp.]